MNKLLEEYPDYAGFVAGAMQPPSDAHDVYTGVSSGAWAWPKGAKARPDLFLLHSPQDELLSFVQPCVLLERLVALREPQEPVHAVSIPQPGPSDKAPGYWYGGRAGDPAAVSVAHVYQVSLHNIPQHVEVYMDRLEVCATVRIRDTDTAYTGIA